MPATARHIALCFIVVYLGGNSLVLAEDSLVDAVAKKSSCPITVHTSHPWTLAESANFRCWSQLDQASARQLAETCEAWRDSLRATWLTVSEKELWIPKCEVVVHPDCMQYNHALGDSRQDLSVGSTRMTIDNGRIVMRRIDLRADVPDWAQAALPHELTHVVLRERFGARKLPRWADEGIAMLSESSEKQEERINQLRDSIRRQPLPTLQYLIRAQCSTDPNLRDTFYSQSLALSSYLISRSTPARFVEFIDESSEIGFDKALKKHYQVEGITALQREWNNWIKQPEGIRIIQMPIQIRREPSSLQLGRRNQN